MNLLTMIPITWDTDQVKFFVGFQVDLVEQPNAVTNKNPGELRIARSARRCAPMRTDASAVLRATLEHSGQLLTTYL